LLIKTILIVNWIGSDGLALFYASLEA